MKNKKTILILFIVSAILFAVSFTFNVLLFSRLPRIIDALDNAYREGYTAGAIQGFQVGLETGRNCITNEVKGECEGVVRMIGNNNFNLWLKK